MVKVYFFSIQFSHILNRIQTRNLPQTTVALAFRIKGGQPTSQDRLGANQTLKKKYIYKEKKQYLHNSIKLMQIAYFCISILVIRRYAVLRPACQGQCWVIRLKGQKKSIFYKNIYFFNYEEPNWTFWCHIFLLYELHGPFWSQDTNYLRKFISLCKLSHFLQTNYK